MRRLNYVLASAMMALMLLGSANAAVSLGNITSSGAVGTSNSFAHDNNGDMVVVSVECTGGTISGVTYDGSAMTLGVSTTDQSSKAYIFYLDGASSGSNQVVVSSDNIYQDATAYSLSDLGDSPIGDSDSASSASTESSVSLSLTAVEGSVIIDGLSFAGTYTSQGAGQTVNRNDNPVSNIVFVSSSKEISSSGSATMSHTLSTTTGYGQAALEIRGVFEPEPSNALFFGSGL